ncbi:MAG: hypothetical protein EOO53_11915 [Gammaproteobacteria bacterium]|nr:MAG: hypothetical protein EOO53_11915 [Gammaproteobacteria bacterium]
MKSVGKLKGEESYRFFLSENELSVSKDKVKGANYYFYFVFFDSNGEPCSVTAVEAAKLYKDVELHPVNYQIQFDVDKLD